MKYLETEFQGIGEVSGTTFTMQQSSDKAFMYKLTDNETSSVRYEVFERRSSPENTAVIGGSTITYEAKETYPKSQHFGQWAWCFLDESKAIERFNELSK